MRVRFEAIRITLAIFSPIPSGLYTIGNSKQAGTFKRYRKLKLLSNQLNCLPLQLLWILNENGVMYLHKDLATPTSPDVEHPPVEIISKAALSHVRQPFAKRCIVVPPSKEPPLSPAE